MKMLGTLSATLIAALTAVAVVAGLRSLPDIKRYLKMRQM
jgi:hypothetical protein